MSHDHGGRLLQHIRALSRKCVALRVRGPTRSSIEAPVAARRWSFTVSALSRFIDFDHELRKAAQPRELFMVDRKVQELERAAYLSEMLGFRIQQSGVKTAQRSRQLVQE